MYAKRFGLRLSKHKKKIRKKDINKGRMDDKKERKKGRKKQGKQKERYREDKTNVLTKQERQKETITKQRKTDWKK